MPGVRALLFRRRWNAEVAADAFCRARLDFIVAGNHGAERRVQSPPFVVLAAPAMKSAIVIAEMAFQFAPVHVA